MHTPSFLVLSIATLLPGLTIAQGTNYCPVVSTPQGHTCNFNGVLGRPSRRIRRDPNTPNPTFEECRDACLQFQDGTSGSCQSFAYGLPKNPTACTLYSSTVDAQQPKSGPANKRSHYWDAACYKIAPTANYKVKNGNFENGKITPWTLDASDEYGVAGITPRGGGDSSKYAAEISIMPPYDNTYDDSVLVFAAAPIIACEGVKYRISYSVKPTSITGENADPNANYVYMAIRVGLPDSYLSYLDSYFCHEVDNNCGSAIRNLTVGQWSHVTDTFYARQQGQLQADVQLSTTSGNSMTVLVDNFSIELAA